MGSTSVPVTITVSSSSSSESFSGVKLRVAVPLLCPGATVSVAVLEVKSEADAGCKPEPGIIDSIKVVGAPRRSLFSVPVTVRLVSPAASPTDVGLTDRFTAVDGSVGGQLPTQQPTQGMRVTGSSSSSSSGMGVTVGSLSTMVTDVPITVRAEFVVVPVILTDSLGSSTVSSTGVKLNVAVSLSSFAGMVRVSVPGFTV